MQEFCVSGQIYFVTVYLTKTNLTLRLCSVKLYDNWGFHEGDYEECRDIKHVQKERYNS
jgi:hypothetical protein